MPSFKDDCISCILTVFRCGYMTPKVKIVVGMKLFKRKQAEIKKVVEDSSHIK